MRKILFIFLGLVAVFFLAWQWKLKKPINAIANAKIAIETPWYLNKYSSPIADENYMLDPEIPLNYVPVPGEEETYMVIDDSGSIINYRHRSKNQRGEWEWKDITAPEISGNYERVEGLANVYKVTDEKGIVSYQRYVRNKNNSWAFVETDAQGVPKDNGEDATNITDNYRRVTDNIYEKYNAKGVFIGYRERVNDGKGNYSWTVVDAPNASAYAIVDKKEEKPLTEENTSNIPKPSADGTYTKTDTSTNTVTENGYNVTYKTIVKSTYDADGNLIKTSKEGPYEVSRVAVGGSGLIPNPSLIASNLDGEVARVSSMVSFNVKKAQEILAKLNAERAAQGVSALAMTPSSEAYKLACIRVADMAIYNHSSSSSPMYGSLEDMIGRFGCVTSNPSENIWKASEKSASDIHTRFQANEGARLVRMSDYTNVGIAVVDKDGQSFVAEVFLN